MTQGPLEERNRLIAEKRCETHGARLLVKQRFDTTTAKLSPGERRDDDAFFIRCARRKCLYTAAFGARPPGTKKYRLITLEPAADIDKVLFELGRTSREFREAMEDVDLAVRPALAPAPLNVIKPTDWDDDSQVAEYGLRLGCDPSFVLQVLQLRETRRLRRAVEESRRTNTAEHAALAAHTSDATAFLAALQARGIEINASLIRRLGLHITGRDFLRE